MESSTPAQRAPTPGDEGSAGVLGDLGPLRCLIEQQREAGLASNELVQSLETAYEELRVADEEVRAQHVELETLRREGRQLRELQERLASQLPVAVLTTDGSATVLTANAAAQALLGVAKQRLLGKPVIVYVRTDDRASLRATLSGLPTMVGARTCRVHLTPRNQPEVEVEIHVAPSGDQHFTWVLRPVGEGVTRGHPGMPRALAELSGLAVEVETISDLAHVAVKTCAETLAPWEVSLVIGEPVEPRATATSTLRAQAVDGAQLQSEEGPCEDAYTTGATVITGDVRHDARWPRLGRALQDVDVLSVVAVPLQSHDGVVGALNVYGGPDAAVDPQTVESSEMLAITLSSLINEIEIRQQIAALQHDLTTALASRATIDQAKGIVMADQKCSADEAFTFLAALSSKRNVKVRDLAQMLVDQVSASSTRSP